MKILQVIPYYCPAWEFGGPVKVAYDISKELVKRGHSVTVYTSDVENKNARVDYTFKKVDGVNVYYFKNLSLFAARKKLFVTPSLLPALKNEISSFDIVHIHGNRTTQNPFLHYFLKKNSIPYLVQAHGGIPSTSGHGLNRLYDLVFGYTLLKDASKVLALSKTEAYQYLDMGVPKDKLAIIPNGINLNDYIKMPSKNSFKEKFGINAGKKVILYLGRIHKTKGIDLLVKAYSRLIHVLKRENVVLVIAGPDDGFLTEIKSLVTSLGLVDSVVFTGFLSYEDKLNALIDSDVFVTPSFYGFPITFLEACMAGSPIVTTTLGDSLEWINCNAGYVTKPNFIALSNAINKIITNDDIRSELSKNCKEIVNTFFSLEKVVNDLEVVYQEVVNHRINGLSGKQQISL